MSSVAGARVLVVSDTHLSPRAPEAEANWRAVTEQLPQSGASLVVHAGDLTLDGAADPGELSHARRLLDSLPVPWVAVPGNHDVGDTARGGPGLRISPPLIERWRSEIGEDCWEVRVGAWRLLGVNAQLFGSELDAERRQWSWLGHARPGGGHRALVCHKPVWATGEELRRAPAYRFVPGPARRRLDHILRGRGVASVISGHVHQFRVLDQPGRRHVWAPTTWAVLPEAAQRSIGSKRCGVVVLDLRDDGSVAVDMVEPPGMRQLTLTVDIEDPYPTG